MRNRTLQPPSLHPPHNQASNNDNSSNKHHSAHNDASQNRLQIGMSTLSEAKQALTVVSQPVGHVWVTAMVKLKALVVGCALPNERQG